MVYYRGLSNVYNDKLEEIKIYLSKRDFKYPYLSQIFNSDEYLFKRQYGTFLEPSFRTKWFVLNTLCISFNEDDTYEFETPIDLGYAKSNKNYLSIILNVFVEIHKQLSNDNYIYNKLKIIINRDAHFFVRKVLVFLIKQRRSLFCFFI